MNEARPDPDELLDRLKRDEAKAKRGKLRIFFGASAGVGKTYAMLSAARQLRAQGVDVVVGVVETHGRSETAALLDGLEQLPAQEIAYRGNLLREFDLDGALARRPALILVDELAHNNAPGSRHPKRWQDVEELLAAGNDVYTTVNVQHLESLNDVVGGITGVRVQETVPDHVFEAADDVVLVDLTPDELIQRLKQGKVYMPAQAERAIQSFFRKGNLIALRELALRRAADRVDHEMQAWRREQSVEPVWRTREALLACVGPDPGADNLVRGAARLAGQLDAPWHAVYVETPELQRLSEARRRRVLDTLQLAQQLGARTATLPGQDAADTVVQFARDHNIGRVVVGRAAAKTRWPLHRRFAERITTGAPELELIEVPAVSGHTTPAAADADRDRRFGTPWSSYAIAVGACAVTTLVATPLLNALDLANIVMLFLLTVLIVAVQLGRGPAVLASFVSVAAFDFFFVPPRFTFAVADWQYVITFAVMLAVALIAGHLTAGLRYQARVATLRETRAQALYELSRELSGTLTTEQVTQISDAFLESGFRAKASLLLPDERDRLHMVSGGANPAVDDAVAQWVYDRGEPAGPGTSTLPGGSVLYLPLKAPMRTRGALAIEAQNSRWLLIPEQRRLLETFATLIAIALERVHYVDVARDALVRMESERLRNSVLAALSHDLRTPLTALLGLADTLMLAHPPLRQEQLDLARSIRDQAQRMTLLVENLLDMARLQAGGVTLNRQWHSLEEVIGGALQLEQAPLTKHKVDVRIAPDLPLVELDAVLIERVLCNLLENAAKYTPAGTVITVSARSNGDRVEVAVSDQGPGLPSGAAERLFDKFVRGSTESTTPGVGLGLAICRAIAEAHGGEIHAETRPEGGATFAFTLPAGTAPPVEAEALSQQPMEQT